MPSGVIATLLQAKAAVITASTSRIAVLPTVPFRVIAPPAARETTVPLPRSRKVESFRAGLPLRMRSEEHTSELQSLMRISYAVFCLKKKKKKKLHTLNHARHKDNN